MRYFLHPLPASGGIDLLTVNPDGTATAACYSRGYALTRPARFHSRGEWAGWISLGKATWRQILLDVRGRLTDQTAPLWQEVTADHAAAAISAAMETAPADVPADSPAAVPVMEPVPAVAVTPVATPVVEPEPASCGSPAGMPSVAPMSEPAPAADREVIELETILAESVRRDTSDPLDGLDTSWLVSTSRFCGLASETDLTPAKPPSRNATLSVPPQPAPLPVRETHKSHSKAAQLLLFGAVAAVTVTAVAALTLSGWIVPVGIGIFLLGGLVS